MIYTHTHTHLQISSETIYTYKLPQRQPTLVSTASKRSSVSRGSIVTGTACHSMLPMRTTTAPSSASAVKYATSHRERARLSGRTFQTDLPLLFVQPGAAADVAASLSGNSCVVGRVDCASSPPLGRSWSGFSSFLSDKPTSQTAISCGNA